MEKKIGKKNNDRLSFYPLKFEEAVKGLVKVKPVNKPSPTKER